jgi:hypothetical protein
MWLTVSLEFSVWTIWGAKTKTPCDGCAACVEPQTPWTPIIPQNTSTIAPGYAQLVG